jgi:OmpR-family two-component system manganese-sensing sensor histidine kinase
MFQETRCRLALWYTVITAIVLLVFAIGIYFYVRTTLIERIDDTLKHVIEIVERSLIIEDVSLAEGRYRVNIQASFRDNYSAVEDDHIDLEWFNPNGELLWSTFKEPLAAPLSFHWGGKTIYISPDYLLRQVTKRIEIGRYVLGYLRVSHPWFEVTKPIRQLIMDLTLGVSIMIVCVGGIGWFLSGIAMKPIRDSYQSLKQFTADASHELRNPIAMIQTNISMLLSYSDSDPQLQEQSLKVIERLTKRLGSLVNDLLFLARADSGIIKVEKQPVPLDALLMEIMEEQKIFAQQKQINLSLEIISPPVSNQISNHNSSSLNSEFNEDIFTLQGDWEQLARLFTNLISNGINHSINEENPTSNPQIKVILQQIKKHQKDYFQVEVKDNGIGISPSDLPHIFERFYRLDNVRSQNKKNPASGTGLGLAIVQKIVENHHGQIKVESTLNQGTNFIVILPDHC